RSDPLTCIDILCFLLHETGPPETYTLSLHDALPICSLSATAPPLPPAPAVSPACRAPTAPSPTSSPCWRGRRFRGRSSIWRPATDRKSTRLNSSHVKISYAVFCLKKKKSKLEPSTMV